LDYADDIGPCPIEIVLSGYIEKYGVEAVLGRKTLSANEIRRMVLADNIYLAFRSRAGYRNGEGKSDWVEWSERNPELAEILNAAEKERNSE
jgi:hypothetical protein